MDDFQFFNDTESYDLEQLPDLSNFYKDYAKAIVKANESDLAFTETNNINQCITNLANTGDHEAMLIVNEI